MGDSARAQGRRHVQGIWGAPKTQGGLIGFRQCLRQHLAGELRSDDNRVAAPARVRGRPGCPIRGRAKFERAQRGRRPG
jgi:hypothetical protein